MKKILFLVSFVLLSIVAICQPTGYPITQTLGSTNTLVDSKGGLKSRPILYFYPDTTTANTEAISRYPFALIGIKDTSTNGSSLWYRSADTTSWLNVATDTSGGGGNAWLIGGNNPAGIVRPYLGTTGNKEIIFITNNRERLGIPAVGITQRFTGVEKMLLFDTTTKYMYWHDLYITTVSSSTCTDTIRYYIGDSLVSQVNVDRQNGLNSGGLVVRSGGTSYFVDSAIYSIQCQRFSTPQFTVTLSPNTGSSNPRIDVIGLNNLGSGAAFVEEGTPSANPQTPSIDPNTQIGLVSVYFPANSDTATVINIYNNYTFNGTDSAAIHTGSISVSPDSTEIYFCNLYGVCDTVKLVQSGGGGGSVTASNGLTASGSNVKLGGTLEEETIIEGYYGVYIGSGAKLRNFTVGSDSIELVSHSSRVRLSGFEGVGIGGTILPPDPSPGSIQSLVIDTADGNVYRKVTPLVYKALISQSSTSAPTAIVLENTFSSVPTWSRDNTGQYKITLTGQFTTGKTLAWIQPNSDDYRNGTFETGANFSSDFIYIFTKNNAQTLDDNLLLNATLIIEVYP